MAKTDTSTFADKLIARLRQFAPARRYWVAFSGGADSYALLAALWQQNSVLGKPIEAVHVHHGLQDIADNWVQHCQLACDELGCPLTVIQAKTTPNEASASPEELARERRMQAFDELLGFGEVILTAHHQNDQAETVLLNLLRGSGVQGLSGMPAARPLGRGRLLRPALDIPSDVLKAFTEASGYTALDDPWNKDLKLRRAWLRHELLPSLHDHWPAAINNISQSAAHCREAANATIGMAVADLADCSDSEGRLDREAYGRLPSLRRSELLRQWIREAGLRPPGREKLLEFDRQVCQSGGHPLLQWREGALRAWRGWIYRLHGAVPDCKAWTQHNENHWRCGRKREVTIVAELGGGIAEQKIRLSDLQIRCRKDGDKIATTAGHRSLKQIFQEADIPPWQRDCWPILCAGNEIVAVVGVVTASIFANIDVEKPGYSVEIKDNYEE